MSHLCGGHIQVFFEERWVHAHKLVDANQEHRLEPKALYVLYAKQEHIALFVAPEMLSGSIKVSQATCSICCQDFIVNFIVSFRPLRAGRRRRKTTQPLHRGQTVPLSHGVAGSGSRCLRPMSSS